MKRFFYFEEKINDFDVDNFEVTNTRLILYELNVRVDYLNRGFHDRIYFSPFSRFLKLSIFRKS
jgi:hypothetical protein